MSEFIFEYYIFVFLAALGAIQLGATAGKVEGLMVLKHRFASVCLGAVLVAAAPVWFFSTGERNINDYEGGITANGQALYAFLGLHYRAGFHPRRLLRWSTSALGEALTRAVRRPSVPETSELPHSGLRQSPVLVQSLAKADEQLFLWLNSGVGKFPLFDQLVRYVVSDYLVPVAALMVLLGLWFAGQQLRGADAHSDRRLRRTRRHGLLQPGGVHHHRALLPAEAVPGRTTSSSSSISPRTPRSRPIRWPSPSP